MMVSEAIIILSFKDAWIALEVHVGLPIHTLGLCNLVCSRASQNFLLDSAHLVEHVSSQKIQEDALEGIMRRFGTSWGGAKMSRSAMRTVHPSVNFLFEKDSAKRVDLTESLQGSGIALGGGLVFKETNAVATH